MAPDLTTLLALVVTLWLLLTVVLQSFLNRHVWQPYQWGLLVAAVVTVLLWPGVAR